MFVSAKCSLVLFIAIASCAGTETGSGKSFLAYDFLYNEGVSMYLQEDWEACAKNLELALKGWHWWNDNTARYERIATLALLSCSLCFFGVTLVAVSVLKDAGVLVL